MELARNIVPAHQDFIVQLERLPHGQDLPLPYYATPLSSGLDISAALESPVVLKPLQRELIPSGFKMALPPQIEAQVRPRSGLALRHGITVLNSPGTIDSDYRGEIKVILINLSQENFTIERGMRIAQLIIAPVLHATIQEVADLDQSPALEREAKGFGSTGLY